MHPTINYKDITYEEKIQYNADQVIAIKEHILAMPLCYCAGIDCLKCPMNVGDSQILCLQNICVTKNGK